MKGFHWKLKDLDLQAQKKSISETEMRNVDFENRVG